MSDLVLERAFHSEGGKLKCCFKLCCVQIKKKEIIGKNVKMVFYSDVQTAVATSQNVTKLQAASRRKTSSAIQQREASGVEMRL